MPSNDLMNIALVGDCLIQHQVSSYKEPRFLALANRLRGADITIGNLECNITQGEDPPAIWAGGGHGATFMATPPFCLEELQWMGVRAVWCANNHSADFGETGMATTLEYLDEAGMYHCGTGLSLTQASSPVYVETPHGRVAILSASDWGPRGKADLPYPIPIGMLAADEEPYFRNRPGANLVRFDAKIHVDDATFNALKRANEGLGWNEAKRVRREGGGRSDPLMGHTMLGREIDTADEIYFMGTIFKRTKGFSFETVPYAVDLERNYKMVREARRQADVVIMGFHQQGAGRTFDNPSDQTLIFARGCIDAGADIFVAHGRGRMGGIEVYKGKAICYGLPGFIMQQDQVRTVPPEMLERWGFPRDAGAGEFLNKRTGAEAGGRSQIGGTGLSHPAEAALAYAEVVFERNGGVREIRMVPMEKTLGTARHQSGRPMLAEKGSDLSRIILENLVARSKPYGTVIDISSGEGVVRLGKGSAPAPAKARARKR